MLVLDLAQTEVMPSNYGSLNFDSGMLGIANGGNVTLERSPTFRGENGLPRFQLHVSMSLTYCSALFQIERAVYGWHTITLNAARIIPGLRHVFR